mmetsp:Transcript_497/g.1156  ORF Transcript_497/g.1156 Transcript_497/m.1156 type:complete len:83 (+) Transcript_497:298-546(+)
MMLLVSYGVSIFFLLSPVDVPDSDELPFVILVTFGLSSTISEFLSHELSLVFQELSLKLLIESDSPFALFPVDVEISPYSDE